MRRAKLRLLATLPILCVGWPALPACPIEHATYADIEGGAELRFLPTAESATVTNSFKMTLDKEVALDGIVMWSDGISRPNGLLTYKCPDGDVTGEEMAACTLWTGVIYVADGQGKIGLLPKEGAEAPKTLILPDLGPSLQLSAAYGAKRFSMVPWDVFSLKGCQE